MIRNPAYIYLNTQRDLVHVSPQVCLAHLPHLQCSQLLPFPQTPLKVLTVTTQRGHGQQWGRFLSVVVVLSKGGGALMEYVVIF